MDQTVPKNILNVHVVTPRRFLYQGFALSVSSRNSEGKFDILPEHANFITLVENQDITIKKPDNTSLVVKVHQAIIFNTENEVEIYAEPTS